MIDIIADSYTQAFMDPVAIARDETLSYLVEIAGLEPAASGLQSRRSPS